MLSLLNIELNFQILLSTRLSLVESVSDTLLMLMTTPFDLVEVKPFYGIRTRTPQMGVVSKCFVENQSVKNIM